MLQNNSFIKERLITRAVTFRLTEPDMAAKARLAAEYASEKSKVEEEFETTKRTFKNKIETWEAKLDLVLQTIRDGAEDRTVEVIERKDFDREMVYFIHMGEVVEERKMLDHERQIELGAIDQVTYTEGPEKIVEPGSRQEQIRDVIREEKKKTKKDHTAN